MKRHLMAAARGARLQRKHYSGKLWLPAPNANEQDAYELRVHPEDQHLEYGPISKALIAYAVTAQWPRGMSGELAASVFRFEQDFPFALASEWKHAQTFALLLAEVFADEAL